MITRTTIGADFEGALTYGAGVRQGDSLKKKAELIGSANLGDVSNPRGLAAEMQTVADENTRCKNPVWHTSLSWAEGEQLSTAQKLQAAERYCELMGASWDAHQVAVYEHRDKKHEHIHIYFNRVPVMGGPAVDTGHNYARNLKAIKTITQELGLTPLPAQRQSFNDRRPPVQDTRQMVRAALVEAMADKQVQSIEQLQARLAAQGIEAKLTRSKENKLVGVSFKQGAAAVTGQEVGFKAAQLRAHYEPEQNQAQGQAQQPAQVPAQLIDQVQRPVADMTRAQAREQLRQAVAAVLATATGGPSLTAGLAAWNVSYRINQNEVGQDVSLSFAQGEHLFEGTELSPAYSIAGLTAQLKANRQAQRPQPAAQLAAAAVPQPQPQSPPPAPELKPESPAPAVKPEPQKPKQAPTKKIKHRR